MKKFMLTTAMCTGVAFAAIAQTAEDVTEGHAMMDNNVPAFLSSDFTGKSIYTLDTDASRAIGQDAAMMTPAERDRLRWTSSGTFIAERDSWSNVGSIDDIVMTKDGEIRGVLVDVGGFLGFGARTVKLDIDQLYFVTEEGAPEDIDDFFVVVAMTEAELENLPEWDHDQLRAGFEVRSYGEWDPADIGQAQGTPVPADGAAPGVGPVFTEQHQMLEGEERTADRLMGASVYDAHGDNIGRVDNVVIGGDNAIESVIVDVGGFLGIGAHTVMLPADDARIGWSDADGDVRVQVSMTAEQLEGMPAYEG
ncbi:MAG: PRC-barrel domain-containing protein [Rubellimicrobium sp.]|nr:PRC-barrel domain-containing protein [Rubellimicrobium sp.]